MAVHNDLGKKGEQLALQHLQQKGYAILATNWRYLKAEIDIIAQQGKTLAVVEVKTRSTGAINAPIEAVNPKKIKLLVAAADAYVVENNLDVEVRFDIVSIIKKGTNFSLEHIQEAFLFF